MSRRAQFVGLVVACLSVAGCGGGASNSSAVHIPGTPVTQSGFSTYSGRGFELSVPAAWKPFEATSPVGLVAVGWSTPVTGNFAILTTYDPHPVTYATEVATETHATGLAYHPTQRSIVNARVPGARAAKLFTFSGPHGAGPYHGQPQHDAYLIVATSGGAIIDVQVVSHGSGQPNPMSVINSFRLAQ